MITITLNEEEAEILRKFAMFWLYDNREYMDKIVEMHPSMSQYYNHFSGTLEHIISSIGKQKGDIDEMSEVW